MINKKNKNDSYTSHTRKFVCKLTRRGGETDGRRKLKIQWLQDCESSSLSSPTKLTMSRNNNNS
jgi:hypothetical protein